MSGDFDPPVTPESVARAKADAMAERREAECITGIQIDDDGTIHLPRERQNVGDSERVAIEAGFAAVRDRQMAQNRPCSAWTVEDRRVFDRARMRFLIEDTHGLEEAIAAEEGR